MGEAALVEVRTERHRSCPGGAHSQVGGHKWSELCNTRWGMAGAVRTSEVRYTVLLCEGRPARGGDSKGPLKKGGPGQKSTLRKSTPDSGRVCVTTQAANVCRQGEEMSRDYPALPGALFQAWSVPETLAWPLRTWESPGHRPRFIFCKDEPASCVETVRWK